MLKRGVIFALMFSLCGVAVAQDKPKDDKAAKPEKAAPTLGIGDKAPELAVEKWVKGEPVKFEKGKVYVVEFWATWCGPCVKSMPHVTELQKKYKDKGVTMIGMTSIDKRGNTLEKVESMVKEKGDEKMGYTVAWDKERTTNSAFMDASGQGGIPCAFLIDQEGRIAWIGHPMQLEEPLEQVVTGKYDIKAAQAKFKEEQAQARDMEAAQGDLRKIQQAMQDEKWDDAVKLIDEQMSKHPGLQPMLCGAKFQALLMGKKDYDKAYAFAREAADKYAPKNENGAQLLNSFAWTILDNEDIEKRDFNVALDLAKKAVELSKEKDGLIMDTLALAYFKKGDTAKAIETQKKAVSLAKDAGVDDDTLGELKDRLKEFEAAGNKKE